MIDIVFVKDVNGDFFLEELTHDWYAQDLEGNVSYFGEDVRQYSNGVEVGTAGSWPAGVNGGLPGIVMEADPEVGDSYRQEYQKRVAEDMAEVLSLGGIVTVPYGTFTGCVVTKDFSPLERRFVENKWYATRIGMVKSIMVKSATDTSELVSIKKK